MVGRVLLIFWQAYNGNLVAIADAGWSWVEAGADVVTPWSPVAANRG